MATAIPPLTDAEKLEFGESSPVLDSQPQRSNLIIASYNIRYARGPFLISGGILRKVGLLNVDNRPQVVAKHLTQAADAFSAGRLLPQVDILALQEADKRTQRTGGHHVARELAEQMQMNWVHAAAGIPRGVKPKVRQWWLDFEEPIDLHDQGDTGVALLSRVPLTQVTRIDLPWHECAWRPRLAIAADIPFGAGKLRLFNVHVDPHAAAGGQLEQLEVIANQADTVTGPTIILGDFNTLSKQKCLESRNFLEQRGFTTPFTSGTPTWRGAGLRLHADWIFSRAVKISRWGVARPLNVSDHWPIWAEVEC
ncbi:MAG TPA: endonuclease/exonuclease/phosphatase family protein [Pyrinomonadaceae bacterium]|nr:endonuclease/exonuclease/phosphatase family protein [Pyrinomonadaceae bacterium]